MKIPRLLLVPLLLGAVLCLHAQPAPTPASAPTDADLTVTTADADFAALQALKAANSPKAPWVIGTAKFLTLLDQHQRAMRSAALAFYLGHPTDPRRWTYVWDVLSFRPIFIKGFTPDVETVKGDGWETIITDEPAKEMWARQYEVWRQEMEVATDVPPAIREGMDWGKFASDFRATTDAKLKGQPYDYSGFRAQFDAHIAKYPTLDQVAYRAPDYLGALEAEMPGTSEEIWQHLKDAPNPAVREAVAKHIRLRELATKPMEMTFTAADGRAVDLKILRGKVVLIDFWATWCGPCKEEIPNVKKVYAAYHDKGFEVVGVSLEDGKLLPKDTPEQTAAKLAKARKVLTDFTTKEDMPWPQYFDGKFWKNEISTQYAISGIPAMFLLDQDGKVVSTNARGELLEKEVKRLLKL